MGKGGGGLRGTPRRSAQSPRLPQAAPAARRRRRSPWRPRDGPLLQAPEGSETNGRRHSSPPGVHPRNVHRGGARQGEAGGRRTKARRGGARGVSGGRARNLSTGSARAPQRSGRTRRRSEALRLATRAPAGRGRGEAGRLRGGERSGGRGKPFGASGGGEVPASGGLALFIGDRDGGDAELIHEAWEQADEEGRGAGFRNRRRFVAVQLLRQTCPLLRCLLPQRRQVGIAPNASMAGADLSTQTTPLRCVGRE